MSKTILTFVSVRKVVFLALVLIFVFGWSATAYAQCDCPFAQTPDEGQYGSPTETPSENPVATETPSENPVATETPSESPVASSGYSGSPEVGSVLSIKALPATGGPLLPLIALGTFALGTGGLLALRRAWWR
ncbi:MAG: hypothetical protein JOZ19_07070 [Rubrobacter sp.]|nr:hypothetical protein [Rubrobacter sp.]